jgi:hypothetical protein
MRKTLSKNLQLIISVAILAILPACGDSAETTPQSLEISGEGSAIEDFAAFYHRFHRDSSFQMARISWPLQGNLIADSITGTRDLYYQQDEWRMHKPMADNPDFIREIEPLTADIFGERIRAKAGNYRIERHFARLSTGWHLTYYQVTSL